MEEKWGSWGVVIFLVILFAFFTNGGIGARTAVANDYVNDNYKAICNSEKSEIINTARTQYLIESVSNANTKAIMEQSARQYDALQAEKLFDAKLALMAKETEIGQLRLSNQIERGFCETVKRPPFFPAGCTPCNQA